MADDVGGLQRLITDRLVMGRGPVDLPSRRERASVRDVSPCSEYTRFTMEGTLKDPFSDLAVLLDVPALGTLFMNGPLLEPRWSSALGYGMAIIEEDTRVHLYRSGKFVIRRARDREHVEACYGLLCDIVRPSVVLPESGMVLYEAMGINRLVRSEWLRSQLVHVLSWPGTEVGSVQPFEGLIEGPDGLRSSLRESISPPLKALFSKIAGGADADHPILEDVRGKVISSMKRSTSDLKGTGQMLSSSACIHLAAERALDIIKEVLPSLKGDTGKVQPFLHIMDLMMSGSEVDLEQIERLEKGALNKGAFVGLITATALLP